MKCITNTYTLFIKRVVTLLFFTGFSCTLDRIFGRSQKCEEMSFSIKISSIFTLLDFWCWEKTETFEVFYATKEGHTLLYYPILNVPVILKCLVSGLSLESMASNTSVGKAFIQHHVYQRKATAFLLMKITSIQQN